MHRTSIEGTREDLSRRINRQNTSRRTRGHADREFRTFADLADWLA